MGRQIGFYQTDSDIYDLLSFLSQHQLHVFDSAGNMLNQVDDLYRQHTVSVNEKYIPTKDYLNSPIEYIIPRPIDTTGITEVRFYHTETSNYEIKKTAGLTIVNNGRFYLPNEYYSNEKIVAIYNLLKKYIRKNHLYSRKRDAYFSQKFVEEYKKGNIHFANFNNVYELTDI